MRNRSPTAGRGGFRRSEQGQALVEFALLAPILILIVVGMVEFAQAWNAYQVLTDAAREGARNAVVDNGMTQGEVEAIIDNQLADAGMDPGNLLTVQFRDPSDGTPSYKAGRGEPTEVYLEYRYDWVWLKALMGWAGGQEFVTLKTAVTMRNE